MRSSPFKRTAHPYRDLDVIDAHAPRFNQAVIGTLSLVAFLTGQPWLLGLLALQLAIGLTLGRRFCLPCLAYFELVQPRFGEGPLEDSRPPRFANMVGLIFLGSGTALLYAGVPAAGWALGLTVSALALLAAATGLCMGCEFYKIAARLRGVAHVKAEHIDPQDVGGLEGTTLVQFTHPLCTDCRAWDERLRELGKPVITVDIQKEPKLAHKYGIAIVPTVIAVDGSGAVTERLAP